MNNDLGSVEHFALFGREADIDFKGILPVDNSEDWLINRWERYAHGYAHATRLLFDALLDGDAYTDDAIFPLLALFRHWLELQLKCICVKLQFQKKMKFKANHNLETFWNPIKEWLPSACARQRETRRKLFGCSEPDISESDLRFTTNIVAEFMNVDSKGDKFRYPEDKKGNRNLAGQGSLDIAAKRDEWSRLHRILETIEKMVDDANWSVG